MALVIDTGPLYAFLDQSDNDHLECLQLIQESIETLLIPAPVLVEVEYLALRDLKRDAMPALLDDIMTGNFQVIDLIWEDYFRVREITARYADAKIGFVDAAVLAVVERLGETKLATLDKRHFSLLRPRHVDALRLLPK